MSRPSLHAVFQEKQGDSNRHIKVSVRVSLSFFPHLQQNLAGGHSQVLLSAGIIHIAMMPIVKTITRIAMAIQPNKSIGIPFKIKKMSLHANARNRPINISRTFAKANPKIFSVAVLIRDLAAAQATNESAQAS